MNFDFIQIQKVGAITQITSKTNSTNKGTFIHEVLFRSNFRQKIKEIDDDYEWGSCPECPQYIASMEHRP